ncbi:hypothetical protein CR513_20279, partial [Mucuna pruriens]
MIMIEIKKLQYKYDYDRIKEPRLQEFQASTVVHEASVRCLSRSRRYRTRIWEARSCRSRRTPVDRNLNVWPLVVDHHRPSKAIIVKGVFFRNSEFLTLYSSNTHHFDNRGSTTSRGMNGIAVRFEGYIDRCGMCGSVGHPPNDYPILQEPPPPFRPQPFTFSRRSSATVSTKQHAVSIKEHAVSTKYKCHNARVEITNWSTGHHDKLAIIPRFWTGSFPSHSQSTGEYE